MKFAFSQDWQDSSLVLQLLQLPQNSKVLLIGSMGELAVAIAEAGALEVVCLPTDAWNVPLTELKILALQKLRPTGVQTLMGCNPKGRRIFLYHQLRSGLGEEGRKFWDQHEALIRLGLIEQGEYEYAWGKIRQLLERRQDKIEPLFGFQQLTEQQRFYERHWGRRWQLLLRVFSRLRLRQPIAFTRLHTLCMESPLHVNPYVRCLLLGGMLRDQAEPEKVQCLQQITPVYQDTQTFLRQHHTEPFDACYIAQRDIASLIPLLPRVLHAHAAIVWQPSITSFVDAPWNKVPELGMSPLQQPLYWVKSTQL